ncbi:hypothetical protein HK107_02880 [Parvularcula sp. ZS-1/3]|uniref:Uncharacterized protein n=1 Tax=Parvularcula mediterranea TaxID=2732508 RepID=A0A7Y3RJJ6_9PROT|nr:hypothetical protein [Parvularcula mediterranea]NNU15269.1 hypothetical protein [Parvularcula mediterranea]
MKSLISLVLAVFGTAMLLHGWIGPLTPAEGFPTLEVIGLYALLPVALIGISVALTESKILKFLLSFLLIGAVALLGYTALSMTVLT